MKYTARQYAVALHQAVSQTHPKDQDKVLDNFARLLGENHATELLAQIQGEYENYDRETRGVELARVTAARKLSPEEEKNIIGELNEYVRGEVELATKVDEGLIGGIVVRIKDELVDGSIRKNLDDLKEELIK